VARTFILRFIQPSSALRLNRRELNSNILCARRSEGQHRSFKPAPEILNVTPSGDWQTAEFHLTEPALLNSQHGGADFRLDVNPPEIYVRRVTLTREEAKP
jgi:hypothetical protein